MLFISKFQFPRLSMAKIDLWDFQLRILKYWNSTTFQVFHDPHEPCNIMDVRLGPKQWCPLTRGICKERCLLTRRVCMLEKFDWITQSFTFLSTENYTRETNYFFHILIMMTYLWKSSSPSCNVKRKKGSSSSVSRTDNSFKRKCYFKQC